MSENYRLEGLPVRHYAKYAASTKARSINPRGVSKLAAVFLPADKTIR
jgi:hypothetical protein